MTRRELITNATAIATTTVFSSPEEAEAEQEAGKPRFKLGTVTYNIAKDWDLQTLISHCKAGGFEGVELRTTHKHGVEPELGKEARQEVRRNFADSGVTLWGLGTVCEFHAPDKAVVQQHIESCKRWCELAKDVGAMGIKVRPNGLPDGVPKEKTLAQIAESLRECGKAADENGVEIWVEVHGGGTAEPPNIRAIMDQCAHPRVGVCWNSNRQDIVNGSVKPSFDLLKRDLKSCHINDLWSDYPYRELFALLRESGYDRFTLCEVGRPVNADTGVVFMQCYRGLWRELQRTTPS
jgi:sugar phosphate isomerase/epimerase